MRPRTLPVDERHWVGKGAVVDHGSGQTNGSLVRDSREYRRGLKPLPLPCPF